MPHTQLPDITSKLCYSCGHVGLGCLTVEEFCDWCILRKAILGWTNQKIADMAKVAKISVDRIMTHDVKDLRATTMLAVANVLKTGLSRIPACAAQQMPTPEYVAKIAALEAEITRLQADIVRKNKVIDKLVDK